MTVNYFGKKVLPLLIFFCLLPTITCAAAGKWYVYKKIQLRNQTKDTILFENRNNQMLLLCFITHMQKNSLKYRAPRYCIDHGKIHDLKTQKSLRFGKTRWFRVILAQANDKTSPIVNEFLKGEELVIQYYPAENIIKEAVFKLEGFKNAIKDIWQLQR